MKTSVKHFGLVVGP